MGTEKTERFQHKDYYKTFNLVEERKIQFGFNSRRHSYHVWSRKIKKKYAVFWNWRMNPRARIKVAKAVKGSYSTTRHCTRSPPLSRPSKFMKFPVWYIIQVHPSDLTMYRDLKLSQWASTIISGLFRVVILVFSRNRREIFLVGFSLSSAWKTQSKGTDEKL